MLDIDREGKMDRAALVQDPDSEYVSLYIYLAVGDEKPDLSHRPDFLKKQITEGSAIGLESKGKRSLIVTSCFDCGANKSWK